MAENLDIDTQELHAQGNANQSVAPFYRAKGKPDQEFHDTFDAVYGLGASSMGARLAEYSKKRQAVWEGIGDFHDGLAQKSHVNANNYETTDTAGDSSTRAYDADV